MVELEHSELDDEVEVNVLDEMLLDEIDEVDEVLIAIVVLLDDDDFD